MARRCTCGHTEFSEQRSKQTNVVQRWIRYSGLLSGMGSGPLGEDLGAGLELGEDYTWALVAVPLVSTRRIVRCKACARVRSSSILGGAGVYGSYTSVDGELLYIVVSDLVDIGCYVVRFQGAETIEVQVERASGTPSIVNYGTPTEFSEDPPAALRVESLLSVVIPAEIRTPGEYMVTLVDRCSSTEYPLGTVFLEDEPMMIPLSSAQHDIPPGMLFRPSTPADLALGYLDPRLIDSIPFEKCLGVLEYDPRLGSLPSGQGWTEVSPGSGQYSLFEGALQQHRSGGANDRWYSSLEIEDYSDRVFGYAVVRTFDTMRASMIAASAEAGDPARGLRFDVEPISNKRQQVLHYPLDGGSVVASNSQDVSPSWLRVGFGAVGNAKMGALEDFVYGWSADTGDFTNSLVPTTDQRLEASFGLHDTYAGYAWYRYVCASVGGKFHRPYFRGTSQVSSPILRLYFFSETAVGDTSARFLIRYGAGSLDPRTRPASTVAATVALEQAGTVYEVALALTGVGAGPVWFSIERDWSHADDLNEATVHLSQITLRAA